MQHAGDGAVVNGFVRRHGLGIVLFHKVIDLGERLEVLTYFTVTAGGTAAVLGVNSAGKARRDDQQNEEEYCGTRITIWHGRPNNSIKGQGLENEVRT